MDREEDSHVCFESAGDEEGNPIFEMRSGMRRRGGRIFNDMRIIYTQYKIIRKLEPKNHRHHASSSSGLITFAPGISPMQSNAVKKT